MHKAKMLEWDSQFFGIPISSYIHTSDSETEEELATLERSGVGLVYVFSPCKNPEINSGLLKKFNGRLVDLKTTYHINIEGVPEKQLSSNIEINKYTEPTSELIELAILSGKYSRYKTDQNFSETQFRKFFAEWITNSVLGKIADYVISYHISGVPLGLVTLSVKGQSGVIGIISVSEQVQNQGIGSKLLHAVFSLCKTHKVKTLEVVTQAANQQACKFYQRNGFSLLNQQCVFHFWLNKLT